MLSIERQERIKNAFLEKKNLTVAELSAMFDVSFETIRRDLRVLEKNGVISKTYGGAMLRQRVKTAADFQALSHVMVEAKEKMATTALQFIAPGDCIYIGFSTTCTHIAALIDNIPITVLTNSLAVMNILSKKDRISLFAGGGCWDAQNCAFMGRTAIDTLAQFHLDKAFLSCRALDMEAGLSDKTEVESDMRRRVIESSNEVYLLVDNSKFNKMTFVKTCGYNRITAVITDVPLTEQWQIFLEKEGVAYYDCSAERPEAEEN